MAISGWPHPTTERQDWQGADWGSRRARRPGRFNASIPAQIRDVELLLPTALGTDLEETAMEVRSLNERHSGESLDAVGSPLIRTESVASSRIENLRVSHRRVAEALEDPLHAKAAAAEVARNVRAMEAAIEIGARRQDLRVADLLLVHQRLLEGTRDEPYAGKVRTEQNWIGGPSPMAALYVPPPHEHVPRLLDDLIAFVNRDDLPVVAQAGIAHAQFEAIHPFVDGNGRTGRCLVHIVFRRRGVAPRLVPPVSSVLLARRDEYFRALAAYQQAGDIETWLETFSAATREAAERAEGLVNAVTELRQDWLIRAGNPRRGSISQRTIDLLVQRPVVSAGTLSAAAGVDPNVARRALNRLEIAGVVKQISHGPRDRVWAADDVFDLLDEFESGIPRGRGPTRHLRNR